MILLNVGDFGGYTNESESWDNILLSDLSKPLGDRDINVNYLSGLREALASTESPADMPSATVSGALIPSNEECGIRDVWAHNLEEEFRTIRQVSVITFLNHFVKIMHVLNLCFNKERLFNFLISVALIRCELYFLFRNLHTS